MNNRYLGKLVTAMVAIPDDASDPKQVRQGVVTGATEAGYPIIQGESGQVYQSVRKTVTVVPKKYQW